VIIVSIVFLIGHQNAILVFIQIGRWFAWNMKELNLFEEMIVQQRQVLKMFLEKCEFTVDLL
jgi:hypothetical protein